LKHFIHPILQLWRNVSQKVRHRVAVLNWEHWVTDSKAEPSKNQQKCICFEENAGMLIKFNKFTKIFSNDVSLHTLIDEWNSKWFEWKIDFQFNYFQQRNCFFCLRVYLKSFNYDFRLWFRFSNHHQIVSFLWKFLINTKFIKKGETVRN
jgi:hypothetical protein